MKTGNHRTNNSRVFLIIGIALFVCVSIVLLYGRSIQDTDTVDKDTSCLNKTRIYKVAGNSMSPLIEDGTEIQGIEDYYNCTGTDPKRGDIVILEDSATRGPYLKTIKALPDDTIEIQDDGSMLVQGAPLQNSAGELYFFNPNELSFLRLYIRGGHLQNGAYFVFGESTSSSLDSRKFGALSREAFRAKITR